MPKTPDLSVIVVGYRMERELPRTIRSLSPAMQKGIRADQYEIIVVDNGSPEPMPLADYPACGAQIFSHRFETNSQSPAAAANFGLARARGRVKGVLIDGARLASPGLLATALLGARLDERAIISSLGFHLGFEQQMTSVHSGYDRGAEDALLAEARWEEDGYRLFDIAALAGSSQDGFFAPIVESNALFMPNRLWRELGGFDERFTTPGGGYVNPDLYRRALDLPQTQLVVMLGEGTFHQVHGGAATNAAASPRDAFLDEYRRLRGRGFEMSLRDAIFMGAAPAAVLPLIQQSAHLALRRQRALAPLRRAPPGFDPEWYLARHKDVAEAGIDPAEHFLKWGQFEGRPWRR